MSLTGGQIRPFREPCAGMEMCRLGPVYQNVRSNEKNRPKFIYSGKVPHCPDAGDPIDPYPRPNAATADPGQCTGDTCPCGPWMSGGGVPCDDSKFYSVDNPPPLDYTQDGTVDLSNCRDRGWKGWAGNRNWHGNKGLISGAAKDTIQSCGGGNYITWKSRVTSPPQTRYLTKRYQRSDEKTSICLPVFGCGAALNNFTYSWALDVTRTINAQSGEVTQTGYSAPGCEIITCDVYDVDGEGNIIVVGSTQERICPSFPEVKGYADTAPVISPDSDLGDVIDFFLNFYNVTSNNWLALISTAGYTATWTDTTAVLKDASGTTVEERGFDTSTGEFYLTQYKQIIDDCTGASSHYGAAIEINCTITETSLEITVTRNNSTDSDALEQWTQVTIQNTYLSSGNSSASVYADWVHLLSFAPLTEGEWRQDPFLGFLPIITRNETPETELNGFSLISSGNDLRYPVNDINGNAPFTTTSTVGNNDCNGRPPSDYNYSGSCAWIPTYSGYIDTRCYCFEFAPGTDATNSAATGIERVIDGKILGMPAPAAFTNIESSLYNPAFAAVANGSYEGYFDFRHESVYGSPTYDSTSGAWSGFEHESISFGEKNNQSIYGLIGSLGALDRRATQWLNLAQCVINRPFAWLSYNDTTQTGRCLIHYVPFRQGLFGAKYAEIAELWQSQNLARPGGDDRFLLDEPALVYGLSEVTGSGVGMTFKPVDRNGSVVTITDTSGIWFGKPLGGGFTISQAGDGTVTLLTKEFDIPTGWSLPSADEDYCFGKMRFPSAPGLLGRVSVTITDVGGGNVNINGADAFKFCKTGDAINLDAKGMVARATNAIITRVDDSNAMATLDFNTVKDSIWMTPYKLFDGVTDGRKFYFCDNYPKGQYGVLKWLLDNQTNAEWNRFFNGDGSPKIVDCSGDPVEAFSANYGYADFTQASRCLPVTRCTQVVCISPNGEEFGQYIDTETDGTIVCSNGHTYPFPDSFTFYPETGSMWCAMPQFTMTDLLYRTPHSPFGNTLGLFDEEVPPYRVHWVEDGTEIEVFDGTSGPLEPTYPPFPFCQEDTLVYTVTLSAIPVKYHAHHPLREPLFELPAANGEIAPTPPEGIQIGWNSPVDHAPGDGDVAFAPDPAGFMCTDGTPAPVAADFFIHDRLCAASLNDSCRFQEIYQDMIIGCGGEAQVSPSLTFGPELVPGGQIYDAFNQYVLSPVTPGKMYLYTKNATDTGAKNGDQLMYKTTLFVAKENNLTLQGNSGNPVTASVKERIS